MLLQYYVVIYTLLKIFTSVNTQSTVDQPCIVKGTGARGVCKVDIRCPKAKADAERGIQPTVCEFLVDSILVVCCEGARATNIQANENSFLNENNEDDKIVYETDTSTDSKLSLTEKKCLEYNKVTIESVEVIPLVSDPRPSSVTISNCPYDGLPLVVGGKPAVAGEFPFMAILGYSGSDGKIQWNCGGTLISDYYVMTAAHCVVTKNGRPVLVRLGELDLTTDNDNSKTQDFGVGEVKVHPNYHALTKYNDIALIRLSKKAKFNKFVRPACLWNKPTMETHSTTVATGWGATENGGAQSDILQKVTLDLLDKSICDDNYKSIKYYKDGLPNTMLCAGKLEGGKDTCQGDSGGPLTVTNEDNKCIFYTVGITSFGRMCALRNTPAVYTKVSEFVPWIEKNVWQ